MSPNDKTKLYDLITLSIEGKISAEQFMLLRQMLNDDHEAVEIYKECISMVTTFRYSDLLKDVDSDFACNIDATLLIELARDEQSAEAILADPENSNKLIERSKEVTIKPKDTYNKFYKIYNYVVSAAAVLLFFFIIYANIFPPQYSIPVATLTDQINVKWAYDSERLKVSERILTNQAPYKIADGIIEIEYDQGVSVIIEGPAEFEVDRAGIYLKHGRLFSSVSESGLGFTVESPYSKFVDLGTEFGVEVDSEGSSELHVIDGAVQFYAGFAGEGKVSKTVREYNAINFDSQSGKVCNVPYKENIFARNIYSGSGLVWRGQNTCSLADIVGGGNGFGTGEINYGFNNRGKLTLLGAITAQYKLNSYKQVENNKFVDSVFIPNGPTRVDSAGNIYADFENSNDKFYLGILNGAWHQHKDGSVPRHALRLDNTVYGSVENPSIYIHANQGITFDLDAVRKYTKMNVNRFVSLCGLADSYGDYIDEISNVRQRVVKEPQASFYVLVDGNERAVIKDATYLDDAVKVIVELNPEDRYLTLATTQGSDGGNEGDWTLFAEPVLELAE